MGVATRNWLERYPERIKSHRVTDVFVSLTIPTAPFRRGEHVTVVELNANASSRYFALDLAQNDVDEIVPVLFRLSGQDLRRSLAEQYLSGLDDTALLDLVAAARARRRQVR